MLAVIVGLVIAVGAVFKVYETADQTHKAICALKQERIKGVREGVRFLEEHPQGIPGISRADILRSIEAQRETVRALRFADC